MRPLSVAISKKRPLGVNWTLDIGAQSVLTIVFVARPSWTFQTRQSPSYDPETINEPSMLQSTLVIGSPCAGISRTDVPERTSHMRIVSSKLPDTYPSTYPYHRHRRPSSAQASPTYPLEYCSSLKRRSLCDLSNDAGISAILCPRR